MQEKGKVQLPETEYLGSKRMFHVNVSEFFQCCCLHKSRETAVSIFTVPYKGAQMPSSVENVMHHSSHSHHSVLAFPSKTPSLPLTLGSHWTLF